MSFEYVVSLRLDGRMAVVVGGGEIAAGRIADLCDAGARVRVVSPSPSDLVLARADEDTVDLQRRSYEVGDLEGATIAIATGEDEFDTEAFWEESRHQHVLTSVLDDLDHTDFAAPALVRSGSLRIAISTGGHAPALARRLREHLEETLGDAAGGLVDALGEARRRLLPRQVPFDEWATRWRTAVADLDGLLARIRAGQADEVVADVVDSIEAE